MKTVCMAAAALILAATSALAAEPGATAPTAKDWADIAKLPDLTGTWSPDIADQFHQISTNPTPWTPEAAKQIAFLNAEEQAGRPKGLFVNCLPEGTPSWFMISHNAIEFVVQPGRVTVLGEADGDRLQRIYTDGRAHSADPDPSFHGESVGHWEGNTLVVDVIGVLPQAYIAVSEAVGLPNNGDLHVVERFHLKDPDTLLIDLDITAPHVLSKPWSTTRIYHRRRGGRFEIVEGVCLQGSFAEGVDASGNSIFTPRPQNAGGNPILPKN